MLLILKKSVSALLVFAVGFTQIFAFPVANAVGSADKADPPNSAETVYDLVLVVVDSDVDRDLTSYFGLREKYPSVLEAGTVGERIVRYADDLRKDNDLTDVRVIIFDKKKESVVDLAQALENLYVTGDGSGNNRLAGVVLVGDVPLPVVNKAGNRFVSMFPYTDFENKAYSYNPGTESFERNDAVSFPKPEIWHGVMRAPSNGPSGMQKLAEYFDKNHLYYEGEPEYAKFDNKLFYADLVHEEENMNGDVYGQYLKFLKSWEDLAYMRYNKFWAKELTDSVAGGLPINSEHPDSGALAAALSTDPLGSLPDIHSKQIIDQYLIPYFRIFGSFLSKTNDFSEYTARYGTGDFDSMPVLISMKDEYTKQYLKKTNDALEKQINKVVAKIEEPLPLLEYSTLTGEFTDADGNDKPFAVALSGNLPNQFIGGQTSALYFKYHYLNENTKDFYINGVNADLLQNAKQCSVYLGSTKSDYFDDDLNYNPKAVDGVFSILTRALRSDSPLSAQPLQTAGVNTRLLAPEEAYKLTDGAVSSGAVVEDDLDFGMPAFLDNPIVGGNYNNPWSTVLQKGDVVYKMNKKELGSDYSFEAAIDEAYRLTARVISATNNGQSQKLAGYPYQIELADNYDLTSGKINRASGIIGVDFYRGGKKKTANFTFTVDKDGKTSKHGPAPDGDAGPRAVLVMTDNYGGFNFDAGTNGAIFTLYDVEQGFGGNGYDNSAGCNSASAGKNSDRCFPWLASMPVIDPAGALMPVKTFEPGKAPSLKFPEDVGEDDYGQPNDSAYPAHLDVMQFPGGGDNDYYKYEELDEVYYNSCYFGMPGVVDNDNLSIDSNPIGFALDPPNDGGNDYDINKDFAGRILDGIADFVWVSGNDNKISPDKAAVMTDIDELNAGDIVVNDLEGDTVTLQHFSDRWGIFDGIDNDGDGITDFYWRDLYMPDGTSGQDGIYETKWYDLEEASTAYGIPGWNPGEIARKMLAHNTSYTLPAVAAISPFGREVTLNVAVAPYGGGKTISSMILHNEPTDHTIFEQVRSQAAFSLPIDNPRYVAFTASPVALPAYPEPKPVVSNPPIDVDSIVSKLNTKPYYFPGKTVRVDYPNLFKTSNYAQVKSDLSTVAWTLTQAYGSYRILGLNASPVNCEKVTTLADSAQCKAIHDEILNKYLDPTVSGVVDNPIDGFELTSAAGDKIIDALKWRDMGIDDKHQYVFEYYLDDSKNAFVGDPTLFPATAGYGLGEGYEAAYLVLDGEKDYFDMEFNKDLPEETDKKFNPIPLGSGTTDGGESSGGEGGESVAEDSEEDSEFEFVDLDQFLKELENFISFFTTKPDYKESCSYVDYANGELSKEAVSAPADNSQMKNSKVENSQVEIISYTDGGYDEMADEMAADGESSMMVEVVVLDESGNIDHSPKKVKFTVSESDFPNMVSFEGPDVVTGKDGAAQINLKAGTKAGRFVIKAEVLDEPYPVAEKELFLVAGEVTAISIDSDSDVLVANGQSKTKLGITLMDKFGNRANNSFSKVALFVSGKAHLDESVDTDSGIFGTQVGTFEGYAGMDLLAENEVGEANVIALLLNYELEEKFHEVGDDWKKIDFTKYVGASKKFTVVGDLDLVLNFDKGAIAADGQSIASLSTTLASGEKVLTQYNGPIKYSIVNGSMGSFVHEPPTKMVNGALHEANVRFKAAKVAGEAEILVEVPGFVTQTVKLKLLPGDPYEVQLSASDEVVYTGGGNEVVLQARILDKNGNLVNTDNTSPVNFSLTDATSALVHFTGAQSAMALNGVASTTVSGRNQSGEANLYAQVGNLKSGTISLKVTKRIDGGIVKSWNPRALYTSLLGGDFGNIAEADNLAQSFLFSGQVQAVSAVSASSDDKKRIFGVDGHGKIELMSDMAGSEVVAATGSFPYQKVVISDYLENTALAEIFVVPNVGSALSLGESEGDGIFVKRISEEDKLIEFIQKDDGIYFEKKGDTLVKVDKFGRITVNDERIVLRLTEEEDGIDVSDFSLVVEDRGQVLAVVTYKQSFVDINGVAKGVNVIAGNVSSFYSGIYVRMLRDDKRYNFVESVSGNSSEDPLGVYLIDRENGIDAGQAPGFSYQSLENARDSIGVGFAGSNKHMLLFAAGNSVGESNMPYASEAGIIFGDPNVKVKVGTIVGLVSKLSGYGKDIGKPLFVGEEQIKEMIDFDFNGDGYDDILLMYEGGLIRLLENEISNKRFRDQGYILNVSLGIISATKIDVNNDGYSDLVVGTENSCRPDEVCVTLYTNKGGNFVGETLNLGIEGDAYEIKAADLNADGCEDLVVSDSAANIRTFYNTDNGDQCLGLQENYGNSVNFGFKVDADVNLKDNLYVHYQGMENPQTSLDPSKDTSNKFVTFVIRTNDYSEFLAGADDSQVATANDASALAASILANGNIASSEIPEQTFPVEFSFMNLPEDGRFGVSSVKQAVDLNGDSVASGDRIEYRIQLKNTGSSSVNGLRLSDLTPASLTLDLESLACPDGCGDDLQWEETGMTARSHVIKHISVPAGGTRTIRYQAVVEEVPAVHFDIGNNFTSYKAPGGAVVAPDELPDIRVRPSVNPDSILTYLYSQPGLNASGHVKYGIYEELPVSVAGSNVGEDNFPDASEIEDNMIYENGVPVGLKPEFKDMLDEKMSKITKGQESDDDFDGCVNSWDKFKDDAGNFADSVADGIENFTSLFRCSGGGCLPIPYNYAFLAPDGATPGIAALAVGVPFFPGFASFYPSVSPSTFRLYINPTLTMGVGTSVCFGAPGAGVCYAFALPMQAMGACPDFLGPINDAVAAAKNVMSSGDAGMSTVVADGEGSTGSDAITSKGNYSGDGPFSASSDVNIRIPGFPSVLTNWFDKQTDEIYNKLLDLPDFYFIYPDVKTLFSEHAIAGANFSKIKNVNDFLSAINSLPLVQIEGREVALKIPAISGNEVAKWKTQAKLWVLHHEEELKRLQEYWTCDISDVRKTLCDKVTVKMTDMIHKVKKLMDKLDQIANLPADILKWRHAESKYATQIICYLDAMMNYTGGYIRRQETRIRSWMKAADDAIKTFKDWKIILDLMAEYQQSCDECKNDRFSKLGLLLSLFVAVPDPPIIPFPKFPDIVFDISQIKTGIKIVWPDIVFIPEPIVLPDLPTITLPEIPLGLPNIVIDLDSIDFDIPDAFLNFPVISMPNLPDLPPLPLPQLPDIPRPPKIPKIPDFVIQLGTNVKTILKILCLIKKGFVPILESALATEIETLTQPNINAVLPIIKNLGFQYPAIEYDYVEQIRIDAKINMGIDTDYIYASAKRGADTVNEKVENTVKEINEYTDFPLQELLNGAVNKGVQKLNEATTIELPDENVDLTSYLMDNPQYAEIQSQVGDLTAYIEKYVAQLDVEETPESYYLAATDDYIDLSDPILNRSISQVEADILLKNLPIPPEMRQVADMRDSMIAYTKGLEESIELLENINDYGEFVTMIADNDESVRQFASTDLPDPVEISEETVQSGFFDNGIEETLIEAAGDYGKRYLAANVDPKEALASASQQASTPKGYYVVVGNKNENVLNYTEELGHNVRNFFSDVDHDEDFDIVYSMGGDVYLKTNYKNSPDHQKGDLLVSGSKSSVSDFVPEGGGMVDGVEVPFESNKTVEISWDPKDKSTYEVVVRKSIDDSYSEAVKVELVDQPKISLDLENGNYYVNVFAIDENGNRSVSSSSSVISPSICADDDAPFPAIGSTEFEIPIFSTLEVDASNSFDTTSDIAEYYIEFEGRVLWNDLNKAINDDGKGAVWDDRTDPHFNIGPFDSVDDIGEHTAVLHVVDEAGMSSEQEIKITVYVPRILLDDTFARTFVANGGTVPESENMPFSLWRNRYIYRVVDEKLVLVPRVEKVTTPSISSNGKYYTDGQGDYEIGDFNLEDMILVENADGKIIAEIDPETGNIGALVEGYTTVVKEAVVPTSPTVVQIVDPGGVVLGSVYVIGDPNIDATLHKGVHFDASNYKSYFGVNLSDLEDDDMYEFRSFGAADKTYPGGAYLVHLGEDDKAMMVVDSAGNILVLDDRVVLEQKPNFHDEDPLVISVKIDKDEVGEILISLLPGLNIVGPKDVPFVTPRAPAASVFYHTDSLVPDSPEYTILRKKGIVDDLTNTSELVHRAEFVKILLNMLCIIPRPAAYQPYTSAEAGGGFSDIEYKQELDWFYPYVKEGALRGFVEGYKGETDPNSGLNPFKAENQITRAEAAKIILEAMESQGIIDMTSVTEGAPWYEPYMAIATNITPYLRSGEVVKNNFFISEQEALRPNEELTRGELFDMALRVLDVYNCFEADGDNDGMSDFCEEKNNIDDPNGDPDKDDLLNIDECYFNLNPNDPDTDKGGTRDGAEIKFGTDPINSSDDPLDSDGDGLTDAAELFVHKTDANNPDTDAGGVNDGDEVMNLTNPLEGKDDYFENEYQEGEDGIYIVPSDCNSCPCVSTFLNKADVVSGDIFFSVISTYDEKSILSKSNDVIIK